MAYIVTTPASRTETTRIISVVTTVLSAFLLFNILFIFLTGDVLMQKIDIVICASIGPTYNNKTHYLNGRNASKSHELMV